MTTTAAVTIHRPTPNPATRTMPRPTVAAAACYLVTDTGIKYRVPFAPNDVALDGYAHRWDTIERPGRKPLVRHAHDDVTKASFDLLIEYPDGRDIGPDLDTLTRIADSTATLTVVGLTKREAGPWRVEGLNIKVRRRRPGNGIMSATVTVDLVEAYDVPSSSKPAPLPANKGPASGGVKKAPPVVKPKPTARYYVVKKGDTLWHIARRFYGVPTAWPKIAAANRKQIRNPHWIYPGQKFVIPPK